MVQFPERCLRRRKRSQNLCLLQHLPYLPRSQERWYASIHLFPPLHNSYARLEFYPDTRKMVQGLVTWDGVCASLYSFSIILKTTSRFVSPYPESRHCPPPPEDRTNKQICRHIPQAPGTKSTPTKPTPTQSNGPRGMFMPFFFHPS